VFGLGCVLRLVAWTGVDKAEVDAPIVIKIHYHQHVEADIRYGETPIINAYETVRWWNCTIHVG
jgi:hypothetical protein